MATSTWPQVQRTEGRAIASLVLGIVGFVAFPLVPSVLAIWLGVTAKRRMRADPTLTGEGLATAGVILGVVEIVLVVLSVILLIGLVTQTGGSPIPTHVSPVSPVTSVGP
jgi:hypothetical protein